MPRFDFIKTIIQDKFLKRNSAIPLLEELKGSGRITDIVSLLGAVFGRKEEVTVRRFIADIFAGEILEIADTANDNVENASAERENVARSKLRIDTRKWLMGHFAPMNYGDRPIAANDKTARRFRGPQLYLPENGRS